MNIRLVGFATALASIGSILAITTACSPNQSPDQLRQKTAQETAAIKQDTKAVADGIKEGLHSDKNAVDLNKASRDELANLPGLDTHKADQIIAERPYADAHQLVTRHVLTDDEYVQIRDRVVVTH
jgi:DNA uptake protein ComE-like DNA-binding protein